MVGRTDIVKSTSQKEVDVEVQKQRLNNRTITIGAVVGVVSLLGSMLHAGEAKVTVSTVVKQGDTVPGFGTVGNLPIDVEVNNDGMWLATLPMTNPTSRIILTSDGVHQAEGEILGKDLEISSLANTYKSLNNLGDIVHRPGFAGDANSGLVWNNDVLIIRDQISTASDFTPGTPYIGFFRAKVNDNNQALLVATVNDEELSGSNHRALVWIDYDPADGSFTETVLAKRYDQLAGQPEGVIVNEFGTGSERFAVNNNGDAIYTVAFTGGDTATNAAIYINDSVVAQKGDFGPFKDAFYNIGSSAATRVDINDAGDYVMLMPLAGGPTDLNQVIVRNNMFTDGPDEVVIRKGDPVPGLDGSAVIASLGTGAQPRLTANGDVVWYASWSGDSGTERGLFFNDQLLVHTGVTETADGDLITNISGTTNTSNGLANGFHISDNGKYIIARAVLNASTTDRAILLIELDTEELCPIVGDLNCDGVVNVSDLLILLGAWGDCPVEGDCPADLNDDGVVNVSDLLILLGNWG
jgi:hypothetical protein